MGHTVRVRHGAHGMARCNFGYEDCNTLGVEAVNATRDAAPRTLLHQLKQPFLNFSARNRVSIGIARSSLGIKSNLLCRCMVHMWVRRVFEDSSTVQAGNKVCCLFDM